METYEKVAASASGERELSIDRLTKIDGIAGKTAEALYEIGVHTYADLDQYLSRRTAQQISAALEEHGVNRPPAFIDQATWAKQARELGELENTAPTPPEEETEPTAQPAETPSSRDSQEPEAMFTVSFDVAPDGDREPVLRTTVCDRANGEQKGVFQGSDTAPWVNWILERAHLPVAVEPIATKVEAEAVTSPGPVEPNGARIEIGDVHLSVVEPAADGSETRLKAEINFQLSGTGAETMASRGVPFRIEGYTVDIESGVSELVASGRSQLLPQVTNYVGQHEFGIPDVGHYEYHSIVLLLPPIGMAAYHRGPTVRVIP